MILFSICFSKNMDIRVSGLNTNIDKNTEDISTLNSKISHVGQIIFSSTLDTMEKVIEAHGGTKWVQIEGRFLLGASSSYTIGSTGGEAAHKLTVSEMPSHAHQVPNHRYYGSKGSNAPVIVASWNSGGDWSENTNTGSTGGNEAHNNMPPYKVVYIWERTA